MKKLPSKVAYFKAQICFQYCHYRHKISPNLKFCSIKIAHRATFTASWDNGILISLRYAKPQQPAAQEITPDSNFCPSRGLIGSEEFSQV